MTYSFKRPFLGMAAWKWLLLPLFVGIVAFTFGRPGRLAAPELGQDLLEPPIWVALTGDGDSFRILRPGEERQELLRGE